MDQLTDNALMLKVKSGDLDKLGLLYQRYKKRLFGFFYNMNGNVAVSEDLVQNVFVRILKYKHTFTGEGSFTAWIFRTARNVNNDHYKKHKNEIQHAQLSSVAYKLADESRLDLKMDKNDEVALLDRAMGKLPPDQREVLILCKYKGIRFSEVGEILGCSEGAAKVKAHRALNDLRNIFLQMETN